MGTELEADDLLVLVEDLLLEGRPGRVALGKIALLGLVGGDEVDAAPGGKDGIEQSREEWVGLDKISIYIMYMNKIKGSHT